MLASVTEQGLREDRQELALPMPGRCPLEFSSISITILRFHRRERLSGVLTSRATVVTGAESAKTIPSRWRARNPGRSETVDGEAVPGDAELAQRRDRLPGEDRGVRLRVVVELPGVHRPDVRPRCRGTGVSRSGSRRGRAAPRPGPGRSGRTWCCSRSASPRPDRVTDVRVVEQQAGFDVRSRIVALEARQPRCAGAPDPRDDPSCGGF